MPGLLQTSGINISLAEIIPLKGGADFGLVLGFRSASNELP
jgi:hypothetical protein